MFLGCKRMLHAHPVQCVLNLPSRFLVVVLRASHTLNEHVGAELVPVRHNNSQEHLHTANSSSLKNRSIMESLPVNATIGIGVDLHKKPLGLLI